MRVRLAATEVEQERARVTIRHPWDQVFLVGISGLEVDLADYFWWGVMISAAVEERVVALAEVVVAEAKMVMSRN